MKSTRLLQKFIRISLLGLTGVLLIVVYCNWSIRNNTEKFIFSVAASVPPNHTGLVLGTSKWRHDGSPNLYFNYRMQAAAELYRLGKIQFIVVSGDNGEKYYNEPKEMRDELVKRGVPANKIYLDYAGFRTLDSVIRCRDIFGQQQFTVISQPFHNQRAVFIARHHGIAAIGYNALDVTGQHSVKTKVRELFAKVKVFLDLYLLDKKPRYAGSTIKVG